MLHAGRENENVFLCVAVSVLILCPVTGEELQQPQNPIGPVGAVLLNTLVGFGLGSFIQGDHTGGGIQCVTELVAGALVLPAFFEAMYGVLAFITFPFGLPVISDTSVNLLTIGMVVLFGARLFGIARPLCCAVNHSAASGGGRIVVGVDPSIEPCCQTRSPHGHRSADSHSCSGVLKGHAAVASEGHPNRTEEVYM